MYTKVSIEEMKKLFGEIQIKLVRVIERYECKWKKIKQKEKKKKTFQRKCV